MAAYDTVKTPQRLTLASLPGELHQHIVSDLDAIGLISLSQTSQYFRSLIKPNKREIGEWLLAIENHREHEAHARQYSEQQSRPEHSRVYKESWELHKCPRCERWQELREFRDPPMIDMTLSPGALCNSCYAQEFDREALGEDLLPHVQGLIVGKMEALERQLTLHERLSGSMWDVLRLRRPLLWVIDNVVRMGYMGHFSHENIDWLTKYHEQYSELRAEAVTHQATGRLLGSFVSLEKVLGFEEWFHCFGELKAEWLWLAAFEERIVRHPGLLADWALGRDGASLE
ncbi:unnamed protein product [Clonostachys byssicola]|uniref:F-box domain-containing protein n=1 Tax=Clonostachys byssicola TaxID=160290 RepID=A0A9N9UL98_9HYPO|nr:unnamed protein product [Clonostachys byssicola]